MNGRSDLRRGVRRMSAGLLSMLLISETGNAHPIHTSVAEISVPRGSRVLSVTLRVFADDFGTASENFARATRSVARNPATQAPDAPLVRYALAAFRITDRSGRALPLTFCGQKRVGEQIWMCLRGTAPAALSGLVIRNRLLVDLHADQINLVQASFGNRKSTLLFTRADGARALP